MMKENLRRFLEMVSKDEALAEYDLQKPAVQELCDDDQDMVVGSGGCSTNGLARCITDSRYMRLIDARATEGLRHNPECSTCEHALQCLAGCRASALEAHPTDVLEIDPADCAIFKGD